MRAFPRASDDVTDDDVNAYADANPMLILIGVLVKTILPTGAGYLYRMHAAGGAESAASADAVASDLPSAVLQRCLH